MLSVHTDEGHKKALLLFTSGEWIRALQTEVLSTIVSEHAHAWNTAQIQEHVEL